ncbi:MAG: hypothetical protein ACTSYM_02940 [Candidatus Baldrarchaeia archaeon]
MIGANKIIDRKKKLSTNKSLIKRRFEELRRKAPECFTKEEMEEDKWALKEWALAKLQQPTISQVIPWVKVE